jgi:hypothetical protein
VLKPTVGIGLASGQLPALVSSSRWSTVGIGLASGQLPTPVSSPRWPTGACPNREQCGNGALAASEVRVVCWLHALPGAKNLLLGIYKSHT